MIDKSQLSIATMTLVRDMNEEALLCESFEILASYDIPVFITDGGSPKHFIDFLKRFPRFIVSDSPVKGLVPQVTNSLTLAAESNREYILYTEPDKKNFFLQLDDFLKIASMDTQSGIFLASRTAAGMASYAGFQQMTETCINNCCSEITGSNLDFTYGPFLMQPGLVSYLEVLTTDIGWGWRTFIFGMAARLGLNLSEYRGEYLCPPDQSEDSSEERTYRVRQCEQSLRGVLLAGTVEIDHRQ